MEAFDEVERIGEGEHKRAIIDVERFKARVEAKRGKYTEPKKPSF